MEKNLYREPMMVQEDFVPHEYIAACYRVHCNIPSSHFLYSETNGVPGLQVRSANGIPADKLEYGEGTFYGCGEYHSGVLVRPERNAYYVTQDRRTVQGWSNETSAENYPEPNCYYWYQQYHRWDLPHHASKLEEGDVDPSNPRSSD